MDLSQLNIGSTITFNNKEYELTSIATLETATGGSVHLELKTKKDAGQIKGVNVSVEQEGTNPGPTLLRAYPDSCYNKDGTLINPGDGYRLLKIGEKLVKNDEIKWFTKGESTDDESWTDIPSFELGDPVSIEEKPMRRKV